MSAESITSRRNSRQRLRERSKTLFGNADRLEVAEAVARSASGLVNGQDLSEELGISPPRVRAQLLAFCAAGLMEQIPKSGLRQYYQRKDDPFWNLITGVAAEWS